MTGPRRTTLALSLLFGGVIVTIGSTALAGERDTRTYQAAVFQPRVERAPPMAYDDMQQASSNHPEAVAHYGPEVDNIAYGTVVRHSDVVLEGNAWTATGANGWMTLAGPEGSFRIPVINGRFAVNVSLRRGSNQFTLRTGRTQSRFALRLRRAIRRPHPLPRTRHQTRRGGHW
ncbi:MAG: hypothetical protein ACI9MR_003643 [Myxococcota bacterium]|jgi:hypothetical protein